MQWKLLASHLIVALVMGGMLYFWLSIKLDQYMTEETRAGLISESRLARLTVAREVSDLRRDAPAMAIAIARETRARVTFITMQGEVVGDSEVGVEELKELDNHLARPEVQAALRSGQGSAIRHSATIKTPMLYVAFPFRCAGGDKGILRLSLPLSALEKTKSSLHAILSFSFTVALITSLMLSYFLSRVSSRSLSTMAKIATRIGSGDLGVRVPVKGSDEVGELAQVMNDMAARIENELKSVAAEKNRLDTILRGMGEGVMVTDSRGMITLVNPAFRKLFDLKEDIEGKAVIEITRHPSLHHAFREVIETMSERIGEIDLPINGGKSLLTHWAPLMEKGMLGGVVAVFHDITELKRLEKVRRDFVANVSHELRTPVTVIKGYSETLLDGVLRTDTDKAGSFLEKIHRHSERLSTLIADLLALSELESGALPAEPVRVDFASTVDHVCALLEEKANAKGVVINRDLKGGGMVLGDRAKLEQVMMNLLDNAINYTPKGGAISILSADDGDMLKVSVRDTGIGIPARDLLRIFERFYRVDPARSREQGGTGLGLSIVKHIVQLYGGDVSAESTPGKGSIFSFTLRQA
jgi:two-component system phosphate regulon sensor histidine kinase PhoR